MNPGDRIRVTFEGVVDGDGDLLTSGRYIYADMLKLGTVDILEHAKPEWAERVGVIVVDGNGHAYQCQREGWHCTCGGMPTFTYDDLVDNFGPFTLVHDPAASL